MIALLLLAVISGLVPLDEQAFKTLIGSQKGHAVLVSFWATWCEPCREEMPQTLALASKLRGSGLKLLVISADDPEQEADAGKFVQSHRVPGQSYIKRAKSDQNFIDAIDPKWSGALPALFLYDRSGRLVKSWIGETDLKQVEAAIRKLK